MDKKFHNCQRNPGMMLGKKRKKREKDSTWWLNSTKLPSSLRRRPERREVGRLGVRKKKISFCQGNILFLWHTHTPTHTHTHTHTHTTPHVYIHTHRHTHMCKQHTHTSILKEHVSIKKNLAAFRGEKATESD